MDILRVVSLPPLARLPLLFLGVLALVVGVMSGWARLGVSDGLPGLATDRAGVHGALMIAAFLGTVISLERAVALGGLWPFLAPLTAGLGGVVLVMGLPLPLAQGLILFAGALLFSGSLGLVRRQPALYLVTLALGALCWLTGSLVWSVTGNISPAVLWWMAFLVLTIAGERLELTRFLPPTDKGRVFFLCILAAILVGLLLSFRVPDAGERLYAASCVALAAWLWRYDIARRTIKQNGLPRFIAVCLLSGYVWLALGGLLGMLGGFSMSAAGTSLRDSALHAIFLGFVFSMIFGHAPIILPAVARVRVAYHPRFYIPWLLLHVSLLIRVGADLVAVTHLDIRQLAALLNGIALAVFIVTLLSSVISARSQKG